MRKNQFIIGVLVILSAIFAIFFVLSSDKTLLTHPQGIIAQKELDLMITDYLLMSIIIVPTFIALFLVTWKYHEKRKSEHDPHQSHGLFRQLILWIIPTIVVAVMAVFTWEGAHKLDPYEPIDSEMKPLTIQVVALDWKWLFIYPEQGIAAVNFVQFPEKTPIHFLLAADGSPMNSFWVPELSGQIYAMAGMTTQLHLMADGVGEYAGRAAEINGAGFADMTFVAKSTSQSEFEQWVRNTKQSPLQLTDSTYNKLLQPSEKHPVTFYSYVREDLFNTIVMKYMHPHHTLRLLHHSIRPWEVGNFALSCLSASSIFSSEPNFPACSARSELYNGLIP